MKSHVIAYLWLRKSRNVNIAITIWMSKKYLQRKSDATDYQNDPPTRTGVGVDLVLLLFGRAMNWFRFFADHVLNLFTVVMPNCEKDFLHAIWSIRFKDSVISNQNKKARNWLRAFRVAPSDIISNLFLEDLEKIWELKKWIPDPCNPHLHYLKHKDKEE